MSRLLLFICLISITITAQNPQNPKVIPKVIVDNMLYMPKFPIKGSGWGWVSGTLNPTKTWDGKEVSLEVRCHDYYSNASFQRKMQLPLNSKKRFFMYFRVFNNNSDNIIFTVRGEDGEELYKHHLNISYNYYDRLLRILYICDKKQSSGTYLEELEVQYEKISTKNFRNNNMSVHIETLSPEDLPENWFGYDQVDLIVLSSSLPFEEFQRKDSKKAKALKEWLMMGGNIMFNPLTDTWLPNSMLAKDILEMSNIQQQAMPLSDTWKSYFEDNVILDNKQVYSLPCDNGISLIDNTFWTANRGLGTVIYMGLPMEKNSKAACKAWLDKLWIFTQNTTERDNNKNSVVAKANEYENNLRELSKQKMPSLGGIMFCIFCYVVIVGPFNFLYLRKKQRTIHLLWTIPVISIVFSVIVLCYGYMSKGMTSKLYQIKFLQPIEGTEYCYEREYSAVFSGGREEYTVSSQDAVIMPLYNSWNERENMKIEYDVTSDIKISNYSLNLWETANFRTDRILHTGKYSVTKTGNTLEISKPADCELRGMLFCSYNNIYVLPDFPKGETQKTIDLKNAKMVPIQRNLVEQVSDFWGVNQQHRLFLNTLYSDNDRHYRKGNMFLAMVDSPSDFSITPEISCEFSMQYLAITPGKGN